MKLLLQKIVLFATSKWYFSYISSLYSNATQFAMQLGLQMFKVIVVINKNGHQMWYKEDFSSRYNFLNNNRQQLCDSYSVSCDYGGNNKCTLKTMFFLFIFYENYIMLLSMLFELTKFYFSVIFVTYGIYSITGLQIFLF